MIIEIISRTPIWVFVLFIFLVVLGYSQTKDRIINVKRTFILPICMLILSLYSIYSSYGISFLSLSVWMLASLLCLCFCIKLSFTPQIKLINNTIKVSGSWLPFILIMIIFSIKYTIGVLTAQNHPIIHNIQFIFFVSLVLGIFNGLFFVKNWMIWVACFSNNKSLSLNKPSYKKQNKLLAKLTTKDTIFRRS